ncbi:MULTISPECIES: hypothetical protein [Streptomyces]|uniref:hypothetical protein n=1 Tax=Streptomyces TaxID=1883 RepID=UPI000F6D7C63|nr:hypothetical protein [Streptomyces sp. W1SF4]AZM92175.1 hypothetical protein D1J60_29960 [Streptomyces sp. W1SF4]
MEEPVAAKGNGGPAALSAEGEFSPAQDRGMLEWARQRPDDGFVVGVALRLRGPRPGPERLASLIAARLAEVPVLQEYLDGPPREERWNPFDSFHVGDHVHVLGGGGDPRTGTERMANQPVPDDRPRWGVWLLDAEREDEYLLAYRVHHAAQDGAAVAHTIRRLFTDRVPAIPLTEQPLEGRRSASCPPCTDDRLLTCVDVPVDTMRAVVRASGASLNDIYLAALAGAVRTWLSPGACQQPVPVRVPFNVRLRTERQDRGNRMGHARLLLPVDEPSAGQRLERMVEQTRFWPRDQIRRILDRAPHHMLWQHIAPSLSPGDALASATLLGIPTPLAFDGAPVIGSTAMPPLAAGHLFSSALLLCGTRATVSFTARGEHQHVRDLPRLWEQELATLAAATRH